MSIWGIFMSWLVTEGCVHRGERSRAVTAVFGSLDVGSVIGLLVCGPLIRNFGWPSVFYLFALLGLIWCLGWPLLKPEEPDTSVPPSAPPTNVSGTAVSYFHDLSMALY